MDHHSAERRAEIIYAKSFSASLCQKSVGSFECFRNRFEKSLRPQRFLTSTLISYQRIRRIRLFLLSCFEKILIDRDRNFRWPKLFCRRVFHKTIGNPSLFECKCYFVAFLWPKIPCMAC